SADDQTNSAHYHIASEPLAPGRGGTPLPANLSNKNLNRVEYNNEISFNNIHILKSDPADEE
ncbi:hypothetical protein, partial [Enterobacter intestinihominis]